MVVTHLMLDPVLRSTVQNLLKIVFRKTTCKQCIALVREEKVLGLYESGDHVSRME